MRHPHAKESSFYDCLMSLQWMGPISTTIAVLFVVYQGFDERSLSKKFSTLAEARTNLPEGSSTQRSIDSTLAILADKIERQSRPRRLLDWLSMFAKILLTLAFLLFTSQWVITAGFDNPEDMDETSRNLAEIAYGFGLICSELGIAILIIVLFTKHEKTHILKK